MKIGQFGSAPQIDGQRGSRGAPASVQQESYRGGARSAALQCFCEGRLQRLVAVVLEQAQELTGLAEGARRATGAGPASRSSAGATGRDWNPISEAVGSTRAISAL